MHVARNTCGLLWIRIPLLGEPQPDVHRDESHVTRNTITDHRLVKDISFSTKLNAKEITLLIKHAQICHLGIGHVPGEPMPHCITYVSYTWIYLDVVDFNGPSSTDMRSI